MLQCSTDFMCSHVRRMHTLQTNTKVVTGRCSHVYIIVISPTLPHEAATADSDCNHEICFFLPTPTAQVNNQPSGQMRSFLFDCKLDTLVFLALTHRIYPSSCRNTLQHSFAAKGFANKMHRSKYSVLGTVCHAQIIYT